VSRAVSFEISRLLNLSSTDAVKLGTKALKPSDIAVLVRTNTQARMVRDSLHAATIPCVLYSDENVFFSAEAFEMEVLLSALAEPYREGLVRTALMTRIFALNPAAVDELSTNEAAWENWIVQFREYHEIWARFGFTPMMKRLMDTQGVRSRLLGMVSGERALTNVLHMAEILGKAEAAEKLGMQGLRKWLAERRDPSVPGSDEYQLRLESDDDAVRVMTVHKSKGLEFPVVFCPFAWGAVKPDKGEGVLFHDDAHNPMLDLGSNEQEDHREKSVRESLAENVRLLYVALTRAKNRCYVAWGKVKGADKSAMAHLMKGVDTTDLHKGLEEFLGSGSGHTRVLDIPRNPPEPPARKALTPDEPVARIFEGTIDRTWGMASYTAFIHGLHKGSEAADRDTLWQGVRQAAQEKVEREKDIFSFPKGARAGILLHEVFEKLDFTAGDDVTRVVVSDTLAGHGFDLAWTDVVTGMVRKVLDVDLGGFRLSGLENSERLTELEFMFPIKQLTRGILEQTIIDCVPFMNIPSPPEGQGQAETPLVPADTHRFSFDPVKGFLRGFMDLIFIYNGKYYLIDWKSNHLGNSVQDYGQDALMKSMIRDSYILQYHLYCVALHRYLRNRQEGYSYDDHFGGVFYVYLRGVDPSKGPEYGIFRARPDEENLVKMSEVLISKDG
jgi:exodeoxyribonuclease V beta subunit